MPTAKHILMHTDTISTSAHLPRKKRARADGQVRKTTAQFIKVNT